jgi:hypothetical protein
MYVAWGWWGQCWALNPGPSAKQAFHCLSSSSSPFFFVVVIGFSFFLILFFGGISV